MKVCSNVTRKESPSRITAVSLSTVTVPRPVSLPPLSSTSHPCRSGEKLTETVTASEPLLAGAVGSARGAACVELVEYHFPEDWYDKVSGPAVDNGYIIKAQFYNNVPRPCYSLRMNQTKPLLDNRDIRIGVGYASNWELVIKQYFRGDYERMESCSP